MNMQGAVKVWDPLVRIFHWSVVVAFFLAYFVEAKDETLAIHVWAGYTVLGLVVFRIIWGFVGTEHARFSDFVYPPKRVFAYAFEVLRGTAQRYLGHNPSGGAMIFLLLIMLLAINISGIAVYGADQHMGPLAGWFAGTGEGEEMEHMLEELHEVLSNVTMVLLAIHVLGVIVESLVHKENLVRAMFTGRKRALDAPGNPVRR